MFFKNQFHGQQVTMGASVLYVVVFVFMLVARPGSRSFYEAFFNVYQALPPLFAGICGLVHVRRGRHAGHAQRTGWLLIALGCLSFAAGQSTWTYYESIRGVAVPFPGWADAGYLGTYPLLITGVVLLFGSVHPAGRARLLLDGAITAGGVAMLSWHYVIANVWQKSDVSRLGKLISVAYPLGDVAALFGALVLLGGGVAAARADLRRAFALLAVGIVLITFSDTVFVLLSLSNSYQTGSWNDWGWSFGWLLIGYAPLTLLWSTTTAETAATAPNGDKEAAVAAASRSLLRTVTPYLAVAAAFLFTAVPSYAEDGSVKNSIVLTGSGLVLLVILRQVLTLLENQHLTVNLEQIVARRTRQLSALHDLTRAVNNTLVVDHVLGAAAEHTRHALHADGVVVRLTESANGGNGEPFPAPLQQGLDNDPGVLAFLSGLPNSDEVALIALPSGGGSYLGAPLRWHQRPVGTIGVLRRSGTFGPTDRAALESIGMEVGGALENARRYAEALDNADRDAVTGLFNHRAIHQRLDQGLARAAASGHSPLTIVLMDMDNFKLFNDTYGHPVGDEMLQYVAQELNAARGPRDTLGRYGGDEFIAVLPDSDAVQARAWVTGLRKRLLEGGYQRPGEQRTIPIMLSFGMATFPVDSASRHELLTIADANLYQAKDSEEGVKSTSDAQRANRALRSEHSFGVLEAMVTAVDNKDRYTSRHSEEVTEYALWIAQEMGFSDETMRVIRVAGLLHDVGKISVPDEILRKPGRLSDEEFAIMKGHAEMGALIVSAVPGMKSILGAVRHHHERWDGAGYPDKLAGENIPLMGRLLAVADAFSAMTTDRPYRRGMNWEGALGEIAANRGTQFDPALADAFLRAAAKRRPAASGLQEAA